MREPGVYGLEELISDVDGSEAYRPMAEAVSEWAGGSWEMQGWHPAREEITWVCEEDLDDDDLDIAMTLEAYAHLMGLAQTGRLYTGCSNCRRVTEV